jgi:hypothetical protein
MQIITETPTPSISSNYVPIELPSKMLFYSEDICHISRLTVADLEKLYYARQTDKLLPMVEIINARIDCDAFGLTYGDAMECLYWLRTNSYLGSKFRARFECKNPEHVQEVNDGKKTAESLYDIRYIQATELKSHDMKVDKVAEMESRVKNTYGISLYPTTMRDMVAIFDALEKASNDAVKGLSSLYSQSEKDLSIGIKFDIEKLTEDAAANAQAKLKIMTYASMLHPSYGDIDARIQKLNELPLEFCQVLDEWEDITKHGTTESAIQVCKECGAESSVEIRLSARDFFPDKLD